MNAADAARRQWPSATPVWLDLGPDTLAWPHSHALGADVAAAVRVMKKLSGPDLVTQGSSDLLHQLLSADVVDELRLLVYPVLLGDGKRLFENGLARASGAARRLTRWLGTRRLQPQLFAMLLIAGLAGLGSALIVPLTWGDRARVAATPEFVLLWLVAAMMLIQPEREAA